MQEDIEKALIRLRIEGKETRKRTARNILIIFLLIVVFYFLPYFYPQLSFLFFIDALIALFGVLYLFLDGISTLYQPLKPTYYAFKKIAKAIEILEKSDEPIAYEEAFRCLKHAHEIMGDIELRRLEWYDETNETIDRFFENLLLIVLPAISNSNIKMEDLEEIALAVCSVNPSKIKTINRKLEKSYEKSEPPQRKLEIMKRRFRESIIGKLLYSLTLGYGVVLGICLIYVVATEQDFMIFARENPEIVVLGGLIVSGITFWRAKPQVSQWKSAEKAKLGK